MKVKDTILIADDDRSLRGIMRDVLQDEGFSVVEATDGRGAVRMFRESRPQAVVLDLNMPMMGGADAMRMIHRIDRSVPVIILTAFGDVPTAVGMIKEGAYDFTLKPPEFDRLIITIRKAVAARSLDVQLASSLEDRFGRSEPVRSVIRQIKQIAPTDMSVIIQVETGTGKSIAAGVIHNLSRRGNGPYVSVDIGLIPEQLVESELFGYKKGAFTGADRDQKGYFESADSGTIFLDELENMSPHIQMKLLSVLERKVVCRLGTPHPVSIDTRVISATNADITRRVEERLFREDLFYRLGEFVITMPPLRERSGDILFFAEKFIRESCSEFNRQIRVLAQDAVEVLMRHSWPGNIRELKNVIKRAVLLTADDIIGRQHIELMQGNKPTTPSLQGLSLKEAMRDVEQRLIAETLKNTGFNKVRAAEILDTSYTNLLAKIKEYGITAHEKQDGLRGNKNFL